MKKQKAPSSQLTKLLFSIKNEGSMTLLLEDLLTPKERKSIEERISILKALTDELDQRTIAKKLHVSIGKITRGSKIIQYGKTNWKNILK